MNKLLFSIFLFLFAIANGVNAQAPFAFNYQGLASNQNDEAYSETNISLRISIVESFADGPIVFSEDHQTTTNERGLFSIRIGMGNPILGNLRAIDWGADSYFIRTEIDPSGGSNYTDLGATQLYSVPYALYAATSGSGAANGDGDDNQTISFSGTSLSIENGNTVNLAALRDGVTDADSDPTNELQTISLNGSTLSLSNGNSVQLPVTGGGGTDNQTLSLTGKILSIRDGNSIDLSSVSTDADADPNNELQTISINGSTLSLSNGNSVQLPSTGGGSDNQTLSLSGSTLSIRDGNSIDLSGLDSDDQTLSLSGTQLTISEGNTLDLSSLGGGGGTSPWRAFGSDGIAYDEGTIFYLNDEGRVALSISQFDNGTSFLSLGGSPDEGRFSLSGNTGLQGRSANDELTLFTGQFDGEGFLSLYNRDDQVINFSSNIRDVGQIETFKKDGTIMTEITSSGDDSSGDIYVYSQGVVASRISAFETGQGFLETRNRDGEPLLRMTTGTSFAGRLNVFGANGSSNISLSNLNNEPNLGFVAIRDEDSNTKSAIYVNQGGMGASFTNGPNGNLNILLSGLASNNNQGYISVHDDDGLEQAGLYVDDNGVGHLFADVKNFRTPHPNQENVDIVYASIEGPEAAAYVRGTSDLMSGKATIILPDHFYQIASEASITVIVTPLSATSKGLAVVTKSTRSFDVVELWEGSGNYKFDWEIKAVRKGFENYEVLMKRDNRKSKISQDDEDKKERDLPSSNNK